MFCPQCGNLLRSKKNANGDNELVCEEHGPSAAKELKLRDSSKKKEKKLIMTDTQEDVTKMVVSERCPKCGNSEAYVDLVQTRAADEAPTKFFTCKQCAHKWRDYS